jgi:hypothetical protein
MRSDHDNAHGARTRATYRGILSRHWGGRIRDRIAAAAALMRIGTRDAPPGHHHLWCSARMLESLGRSIRRRDHRGHALFRRCGAGLERRPGRLRRKRRHHSGRRDVGHRGYGRRHVRSEWIRCHGRHRCRDTARSWRRRRFGWRDRRRHAGSELRSRAHPRQPHVGRARDRRAVRRQGHHRGRPALGRPVPPAQSDRAQRRQHVP